MTLEKRLRKEIPSCAFDQEELKEYLLMAMDEFNSNAPVTSFTLQDIATKKKEYIEPVLKRAAAFACFSLLINLTSFKDKLMKEYNYSIVRKRDFCVLSSKAKNKNK